MAAHQQQLPLPPVAAEAAALLEEELSSCQPSIARASIIMGLLQERLFAHSDEPLCPAVELHMAKFREQLVAPAATKLRPTLKKPQDKVIAIAKFLRGKLAKAPAHKQPLHTQYLPSALRDSGKRQLDCLGIATAVLALCHAMGTQHADLASSVMVVSDDHCWIALPQPQPQQDEPGRSDAQQQQQQQQLLHHVEVTDPRALNTAQMCNWLYANGHGAQACTAQQVIMILVAGLMPEELKDETAAAQLAAVQMALLTQLAGQHPTSLLYSNYFRWGMLHEELEIEQLAASAEGGDMGELQRLSLLNSEQLQSQQYYSESIRHSSGPQWHPHSCATFGWLNRMQAALCGNTDELLALSSTWHAKAAAKHAVSGSNERQQDAVSVPQQSIPDAAVWLQIGSFLLQQALKSLAGCSAVLLQYSGSAGKPDRSADKQLLEAVRDLWQNLADACKAVACLQSMAALQANALPRQQYCAAAETAVDDKREAVNQSSSTDATSEQGGHLGKDVPAAAAVTGHNVHLAAALVRLQRQQPQLQATTSANVLANASWLQALLLYMDAVCAYFGEESADLPAEFVADFVVAAGTFTPQSRVAAVSQAASAQQLQSSRMKALAEAGSAAAVVWAELGADLQQLVQMPNSRKRKRKEL